MILLISFIAGFVAGAAFMRYLWLQAAQDLI
jgi:hypothetical protein